MDNKRADFRLRFETLKRISREMIPPAVLAVAIFLGVVAWLDAGQFRVLAGDDLRGFFTASQGLKAYYDLLVSLFRFRPIAAFFIWAAARVSSGQFGELLLLGAGLHTFNAFLFWGLLRKALRVTPGIAFGLTVIATFNRFIAYFLTPELAIIEGAATAFYLLFLWALLRLLASPRPSGAAAVGFLFLIVLHIHERYMVLAAGAFVVAVLIYRSNRQASLTAAGATGASLLFNFCFKKLFLAAPILMGTTTQLIEFKPGQIAGFCIDGIFNIMGINRGPSYLSVLAYAESPLWLRVLSWICAGLALSILACGLLYLARTWKRANVQPRFPWQPTLLLTVLVAVLILSASITFRQEYRWLYPAYLTFLALLGLIARACTNLSRGRTATLALAGFCLLAIPRELAIREHRDNYYARSAYLIANDLYFLMEHSPDLLQTEEVAIGGAAVPNFDWIFMQGVFAQSYKLPALDFPPAEVRSSPPSGQSFIRYNSALKEFTFAILPSTRNRIADLADAKIVSLQSGHLDTPNGKPSFSLPFGGVEGWALIAPVIVEVSVPEGSRMLSLTVSPALTVGDGVSFILTADLPRGGATELISTEVRPLRDSTKPNWKTYRVRLPDNCSRLHLSLRSGTGDATGDWLCFKDFTFE
jgi:hypothetical protein